MNKRELYYQRLISCGLGVIFLQIREINDVILNYFQKATLSIVC